MVLAEPEKALKAQLAWVSVFEEATTLSTKPFQTNENIIFMSNNLEKKYQVVSNEHITSPELIVIMSSVKLLEIPSSQDTRDYSIRWFSFVDEKKDLVT